MSTLRYCAARYARYSYSYSDLHRLRVAYASSCNDLHTPQCSTAPYISTPAILLGYFRLFSSAQAAAPDLVTPALTHAARHVLSPADAPTSLRNNNELLMAGMAGALGRAALAAPVRRRISPELIAELMAEFIAESIAICCYALGGLRNSP